MRAPPLHTAPTPARARRPWRRLLLLAAAVLAGHALLIAQWGAGGRRTGSGHGPAPRPMLLVPAAPPPPFAQPLAEAGAPPAAVAAARSPPTPPARPAQPPRSVDGPPPAADAPGAGETVAALWPGLPALPATAASQAAPDAEADADAGIPPPAADGAPPPVYATRLPLPAVLRYRVSGPTPSAAGSGAAGALALPTGEARLVLRHDGQRYTLQLDAQAGGRPLLEQASTGGFDAAGLAPERFTDRRRGRGWRAANFRRDTARIGFSGPRIDYPLLPGTQDRLSALAQLVAIVAAAPETPPADGIRMFVADARGWAETWHWQLDGHETVDTPLGTLGLLHWRREPGRPEGLRVQAWLDPSRGHWPARLRFTALRSGQVLDLLLAAEPAAPP